jgi:IMP dehydrogenase
MVENKIEKLPLVLDNNIVALISLKDIEKDEALSRPNRDNFGRLLVGAAVGVKEEDYVRAKKLVEGGVDVLVIDVANGHNDVCINAVKKLKEEHEGVDIVAGSVATG